MGGLLVPVGGGRVRDTLNGRHGYGQQETRVRATQILLSVVSQICCHGNLHFVLIWLLNSWYKLIGHMGMRQWHA